MTREIFVFLVVCVNESWKLPVGYFPTVNLTSVQKLNIVTHFLENMLKVGAEVIGVDGLYSNITMAKMLGANLEFPNLNPKFHVNNCNNEFIAILEKGEKACTLEIS